MIDTPGKLVVRTLGVFKHEGREEHEESNLKLRAHRALRGFKISTHEHAPLKVIKDRRARSVAEVLTPSGTGSDGEPGEISANQCKLVVTN